VFQELSSKNPNSTKKLVLGVLHPWPYASFLRTLFTHTLFFHSLFVYFASGCNVFSCLSLDIDRFSAWSFRLSDVIQPVAIQVWRPPFADVAASALATGIWADVFWFLFVPCTIFTLR
jgi:hypothetical protein